MASPRIPNRRLGIRGDRKSASSACQQGFRRFLKRVECAGFKYYRPGNILLLYPDSGDGSQTTNMVLTGNNTVANRQCAISAQGASVQTSGNTLTVTLPITFKPAFAGFKAVWMAAYTVDAHVSPWQALGAEAVPAQ
jgi:hypothetical protein